MHAAKLDKSARLQRVADLLKTGGIYSTMEIIEKAQVCAVNSICAELRENGMTIDCWREGDKWYYRKILCN